MSIATPNIYLTTEMKEELSDDGMSSIDTVSRVSSIESESGGRKDANDPDVLLSDVHDAEFEHDCIERKETSITVVTEEVSCEAEYLIKFLLMFVNEIRRSKGLADLYRLSYDMLLGLHVPDFADYLIGSLIAYCFFNRTRGVYYKNEYEIYQIEDSAFDRSETAVIELSETSIPRQRFCPMIDDGDLGQKAMDSALSLDSNRCNSLYSATTDEIITKRDDAVADDCPCFESFYSVKESVFPIVKEKKPIFGYESESSPICRSVSLHSKTEVRLNPNSSLLNSFDDTIPVIEINPAEELLNEENHHVLDMPTNAHKKSRVNWIRRLLCFSA